MVYNIVAKKEHTIKTKEEIRKEIIRRLRDQDPSSRKKRSEIIQEKLLSLEEFRTSKTVMTYVSLPSEVDTRLFNIEALKRGKKVAVPYIEPLGQTIIASELTSIEQLEKGPYGIYQPNKTQLKRVPLKEVDLIVVPAIAFRKDNMRLGRGKGYYDKFLAERELSSAVSIGLAFHFQIVDTFLVDPHDIPVFRVLTD